MGSFRVGWTGTGPLADSGISPDDPWCYLLSGEGLSSAGGADVGHISDTLEPGRSTAAVAVYFVFLAANVGGPEALRKAWIEPLSDLVLPQTLPQGRFSAFLGVPRNTKTLRFAGLS